MVVVVVVVVVVADVVVDGIGGGGPPPPLPPLPTLKTAVVCGAFPKAYRGVVIGCVYDGHHCSPTQRQAVWSLLEIIERTAPNGGHGP